MGDGLAVTREVTAPVRNTDKAKYNSRSQNFKKERRYDALTRKQPIFYGWWIVVGLFAIEKQARLSPTSLLGIFVSEYGSHITVRDFIHRPFEIRWAAVSVQAAS